MQLRQSRIDKQFKENNHKNNQVTNNEIIFILKICCLKIKENHKSRNELSKTAQIAFFREALLVYLDMISIFSKLYASLLCVWVYVCVYECMFVYICACLCVCISACLCVRVHVCV